MQQEWIEQLEKTSRWILFGQTLLNLKNCLDLLGLQRRSKADLKEYLSKYLSELSESQVQIIIFLRSFTYTIHKTPTTLLQCDEENKLISYFKTSISLILFWYFNSKLELRDLAAFFLSFPITDVIGIL